MAPIIPFVEPVEFAAGDTVSWLKSLSDFPVSEGWAVSYAFRGEKGDGAQDVSCTASGDSYAALITATQSNLMRAGDWVWNCYAARAGERYKVGQGTTKVTPNLAVTNFSSDLRSDIKIAYDNAMAAWKTFERFKTVSLNGRIWTAQDASELIQYVDKCRTDWWQEQQSQLVEQGLAPGGDPRKIYVRFTDPKRS